MITKTIRRFTPTPGKICFIADTVVLIGGVVEPESIYAGILAKKIGEVNEKQIEGRGQKTAGNHIKYAACCREERSI